MGYSLFSKWLSDKKGGAIFTCFGGWHFVWIISTVLVALLIVFLIKNKAQDHKK